MWRRFVGHTESVKARIGAAIVIAIAVGPQVSRAEEFTAGVVMEKMSAGERSMFVAGVIEGLAHARFETDGRETAGRSCIYRWFYQDQTAMAQVEEAFDRYPDRLPGSVVGALIQIRCPA